MTCIVYKDGVLASDSLACRGDFKGGYAKKIIKTKGGFLCGGAGSLEAVTEFLNFMERTATSKKLKIQDIDFGEIVKIEDFTALIITPEGEVWYLEGLTPFQVETEAHTIGNGSDIAIGALFMGATAEKAVESAIKYHTDCGGSVQKVEL